MENKDDQTLEGGAEEAKDLELEETSEVTPEKTPKKEPSSDPLDAIEDEEARNEAKRARTEQRRRDRANKAKEEPVEAPSEKPESGFLTKKDFEKSNERKAILAVTKESESDSDEVKARKKYVTENWEQIKTFYASRNGKETPEDIIEDLNDAVTLFEKKNPAPVEDNTSELSTTTGSGGGSIPKSTETKTEPPEFKLPIQPKDWYQHPNPPEEKSE